MPTRLLSFLNDIEHALAQEPAGAASKWACQRMVNFKDGLARMTLSQAAPGSTPEVSGTILIQSFLLSDGSPCLKAMLSWERSAATSTIAVHAKPLIDWAGEARQIAAAWLAGPPATATIESSGIAPASAAVLPAKNAASG